MLEFNFESLLFPSPLTSTQIPWPLTSDLWPLSLTVIIGIWLLTSAPRPFDLPLSIDLWSWTCDLLQLGWWGRLLPLLTGVICLSKESGDRQLAGGSSTLTGHVLCTFPGEKGPQGRRAVYWNLSSRGRVEEGFGGGLSWFASMAHGPRQSLLMLCGTADLAPDSHLRIPPPPPSQGGRKQATIEHLLCAFTRPHDLKH